MYKPLSDTLKSVVDALKLLTKVEGGLLFRAVKPAAISSEDQLWAVYDAINVVPCAIVFYGPAQYEEQALVRKHTVMVCVIDEFRASSSSKSDGVLPLADEVIDFFDPECPEDEKIVFKEIDDIRFEIKNHRPVASPERLTAFAIEIEATELAAYEIVE